MHGIFKSFACYNGSYCNKKNVSKIDEQSDYEDGTPVLHYHAWGNHHSDRNEEYCTEEVLYRCNELFNTFGFEGFSKNGTHDEGSEGC